ncbi:TIGR01777 family oxidoreductase [Protaetiibacter mangrovi]|uniref:TIGR01777 family oxidoreductase n=1 Tax=Protaetiibacter mangrovi TaxID=2970926 RepID=A0ABT1ZH57_9MICO|nr:TIGR01777 family oxidoreductase [Protaetiibacter mangrovi]MCS0500055.1 TIGR01777 family oxidoreductase [Protaetiibacter mangrovi]TPX03156.1 TIGR01777 family protein [Schumannella luteola]
MRVVVGGASGMIGRALVARLRERGDRVVVLVRRTPEGADEIRWDPARGHLDPAALADADAVVNLSGASLSKLPWTRRWRGEILSSRVQATTALVGALHARAAAGSPVPVFVSGSAVGVYGDRPDEELTEASAPGGGFLAEVVRTWEATALGAPDGTRVALARTGLVVGPDGATAPLRALARFGLAGPLGSGRQHWPWISLDDEADALVHLLDADIRGAVNLVGPQSATAADVIRAVAADAGRPYWLPAPSVAIATLLGDAGRELLLSDQLVRPTVLADTGFAFRHPSVEQAVAAVA